MLVCSPLLWWLLLSVLSYFTFLEPPFTASRGLVLAMQLFFAPASIIAVIVGVGLMRRSDRMRRIARVLFLISVGLAAVQLGLQVALARFDSNTLLGLASITFSILYWWYFGRPAVRQQFRASAPRASAPAASPAATGEARGTVQHSRALVLGASLECLLGLAAALMLAKLYGVLYGMPLLDMGGGDSVAAADDLLKAFLFVSFGVLIAPHALSTAACIGILLERNMTGMARRYVLVACWTAVGGLLLTAWLLMRPGFAFDAPTAKLLIVFFGLSLVWHAGFLVLLARTRPPAVK